VGVTGTILGVVTEVALLIAVEADTGGEFMEAEDMASLGMLKAGMLEAGMFEAGMLEAGMLELGMSELGMSELGMLELGMFEPGAEAEVIMLAELVTDEPMEADIMLV
jgi:hypothetical protein